MSLDIQIKVDPGNSAAAADKVTAALHKTEDAAEAVNKEAAKIGPTVTKSARDGSTAQDKLKRNADVLARSFAGITQALEQEQRMLDKIHGPMKRAAEDAATLERLHKRGAISATEYAAALGKAANANPADAVRLGAPAAPKAGKWEAKLGEMRTGVTMGVASQLLGNAGQMTDLLGTMKEITGLPIGGTGTALGFMVGGPMGAAIGTAVEATGEWLQANTTVLDSLDQTAIKQAALNGELGEQVRLAAEIEAKSRPILEVLGGSVAHMQLLTKSTSLFADLAGNAADMFDRLGGVLRSAPVQKFISGMAGGIADMKAQLDDIDGPLKKFQLGQKSLDALLAAGTINIGEYTARMGELTQGFASSDNALGALIKQTEKKAVADKAAAAAAKTHADEVKRLSAMVFGDPTKNKSYTQREYEKSQAGWAADDARSAWDDDVQRKMDALSAPPEPNLAADLAAHNGGKNPWDKGGNTAEMKLQLDALASLEQAAHSMGDALVDAFTEADFSASKFFENLSKQMLKQAVSGLINAGLFSLGIPGLGGARTGMDAMVPAGTAPFLPGFATGGDMLVGGSGGPDTKIAAFRVSPGESIHVRTPQQRDQAQASKGGGARAVTINLNGTGRDAVTEHNIEGLVLRVVERNNPAIRSRLRG
jgi:hypothetical protein